MPTPAAPSVHRVADRAALTGARTAWYAGRGPAGTRALSGAGAASCLIKRKESVEFSVKRPAPDGRMDSELAALVGRMADGDDVALAALYDVTSPTVHGLVLRIVRDTGAAEEVTIDVYTQAFRQAGRYDSHRGSPWAWLLTIARSRALDRVRAERRHSRAQQPLETLSELTGGDPDPEASSSLAERGRLVRAALARLSPDQRQAIEIAYFSGLSQSEIAERLGHPIGTVKTRIRTGLMRLREALTPLLVEDRP